MKSYFALLAFCFSSLFSAENDDGRPCCSKKIVGGKTYMHTGKLDEMEAMKYKCSSPCLYKMEGNDDIEFCFKPGRQESTCAMMGSSLPMSPTQGPPGGL